jgi:uncharacterized protein YmfQ (DUF2313 family)
MTTRLFKNRQLDEIANSLAHYLPGGGLFGAAFKEGSVLRSFILGLSGEYQRATNQLRLLITELDPRTTSLFIREMEENVGIPDDCFNGTGSIEERRLHVTIKMAMMNVQNPLDFVRLAEMLGFSIQIYHPISEYLLPQTVQFVVQNAKILRNTFIIQGNKLVPNALPQTVSFIVNQSGEQTILKCVLEKVKPAQSTIIYQNS